MYENITYEALKALPDEQKKEALMELSGLYPSNKKLSEKLGAAPIAIANLVRKFLEGKPVGRVKKEEVKLEIVQPEVKHEIKQEAPEKPKRKYERKIILKPEIAQEDETILVKEPEQNIEFLKIHINNNAVIGSELKYRLNGLANVVLDNKKYKTTITLEEI